MSNIYFLNTNFIDTDVVSNSYVSSEQAAFPVSNVYNQQRRSKVWRSNGYWEITSSNNGIVFEETTSTPLTASIAAAEYTSSTSFLTAIKTALEAVGASTYTVSQDATTGKIKIASDGGGGGGVLNLLWTDAGSTAASILGYDTSADQTGALTYTADVLKIATGEWIKWDLGISSNPTAFVLVGPRNEPIRISPSATLKLQGNETDSWSSPSYETTLTYHDSVIYTLDTDGLHSEGLRYWRLSISDTSNPLGYVEIGSLFLGTLYTPTRGAAQFPLRSLPVDRTETIFSEGGQTFSDIREKTSRFEIQMIGLTYAEQESLMDIFDTYGIGRPFFVVLDPNQVFSSSINLSIRFVKWEAEPQFELVSPNHFRAQMLFREEL
jgi:hypothetical protein